MSRDSRPVFGAGERVIAQAAGTFSGPRSQTKSMNDPNPEKALEQFLQDHGGAVLLRLWDDELGWSVLIHDPDTADGEPPRPNLNDTSGWSHDHDYSAALAKELQRHDIDAVRERLGLAV